MQLRIRTDASGSTRIVRLDGECDIASAPQLQETLQPLRPPEVEHVFVDVSGLDFLDSTGLGVIVGALKRMRESGGELTIAGASGPVKRVLEITGLDTVIPMVDAAPPAG